MAAPEHASYRSKRFFLHLPGRPHMAVRDRGTASFTTLGPPAQPRHLGRCGGLVDEDQFLGIEIELSVEPCATAALDVRALLLAGMRRLFLNVMPRLSRNIHTVEATARTLCLLATFSAISAKVMSGVSSISSTLKASCGSSFEPDGWPCLRATVSPVSR